MSRHPNSKSTAVLQALATRPAASTAELACATGLDLPQVERALKYGRTSGVVDSDRQGNTWRHWLCGAIRLPEPPARDRVLAAVRSGVTTIAEIAASTGLARNTVQQSLPRLERDGLIVVDACDRAHRILPSPLALQAAK